MRQFIYWIYFISSILIAFAGHSQCPDVSTNIQDVVCLDAPFQINNTSESGLDFTWDFCSGDLDSAFFSSTLSTSISNPRRILDLSFADSSGVWYGFGVSWADDALVRMKFGNGLDQSPTETTNLGTLGTIDQPISIETYQQNDMWYALVYAWNKELTRLTFSNGLESLPTATKIGENLGQSLSKMHLASSKNELKALIVNPSNTLTIVDLKGDITYSPQAEDISTTSTIAGLSSARDIETFKVCDQWYGYVSSYTSGTITRVDFGDTISSTIEGSGTLISNHFGGNINRIGLMQNGTDYYLQVLTFNGKLFNVSIGSNPLITGLGSEAVHQYGSSFTYGQGYSLRVVKDYGTWRGFVLNDQAGNIYKLFFEDECDVNNQISSEINPVGIRYNTPGTYTISLVGEDEFGSISTIFEDITVLDESISNVDWMMTNECIDSESTFKVIGDTSGLSFNWDLDGDELIDESGYELVIDLALGYGFSPEISYPITLYVTNGSGCELVITKEIILFNQPTASFTPPNTNLCTNTPLSFTNESLYNEGSVVVWVWDFDGDSIVDSNDFSPMYTFSTSGSKTITLSAILEDGCVSQHQETINLNEGPAIDFQWTNNCPDTPIQFQNLSETENVSFLWDFGDSTETVIERDPIHLYDSASTYQVELTVFESESGCESILVKEIIVSTSPISEMSIAGANHYVGDPVDFSGIDLTNAGDSIVGWEWTFDSIDTSTSKDTSFVFGEYGLYNISLDVMSAQGCSNLIQEQITINPQPCPPISFEISNNELCIGEYVSQTNSINDSYDFEWDFCDNELDTASFSTTMVTTVSNPRRLLDIAFAKEDSIWYGFAVSWADDQVIRFDFGNGIGEAPTQISNLGNFSNIDQPISIKMHQQNSVWYGLLYSWDKKLTRLTFENGLNQSPTSEVMATNLGEVSAKMEIANSGDELKAVIVNPSNTITIIDFRGDITNNPTGEDISTTSAITGLSSPRDIVLFKVCNAWHAYVSSYTTSTITRVDFGDTLTSSVEGSQTLISNYFGSNINSIGLIISRGSYYLQVATVSGRLYNVTIGNDPLVSGLNVSAVNRYAESSSYAQGYSLSILKADGKWLGYIMEDLNGNLFRIDYEDDCSASQPVSYEKNPLGIYYNDPGNYNISLQVTDEFGSVNSLFNEVTITPSTAPDIAVSISSNQCIANPNTFTSSNVSGNITSYSWDFDGDGVEDSTDPNPTYQFAEAGTYEVRLSVESDEGCGNFAQESITIYPEPPVPVFTVPKDSFCVGEPVVISNLTDDAAWDGIVEYVWTVTDLTDTTNAAPELTFAQPGEKIIRVVSQIPGCESIEVTDTVQVIESPVVDFTADPVCDGETTIFTNNSEVGTLFWDFGDGNTSTELNPTHTFATPNTYSVSLAVTNDLECTTTLVKEVAVNAMPQANFQYDLVCAGSESIFEDMSVVDQADISSWQWLVDGELVSEDQFPVIMFPTAGDYTVRLIAGSTKGCESFYEEVVTVGAAPDAGIGIELGCLGEPTVFTDLTDPAEVLTRSWMIDGQPYTDESPSFTFNDLGDYEVELTVTNNQLCSSIVTERFTIYELPVPGFSISGQCNNEIIVLEDESTSTGDPINLRQWYIDNTLLGEGTSVSLSDYPPGTYDFRLEVSTENGCVVSSEETFEIAETPTASFTASNDYGVPPFRLDFSNTSQMATVNEWYVNDALITTNPSPSIVFNDSGSQHVKLITYNATGCVDTAEMFINAIEPVVDLAVIGVQLVEDGNSYDIVLDVKNASNLPIEAMSVNVELQNQFSVSEQVYQRINSGDESIVMLGTSIPKSTTGPAYLCISISSSYDEDAANLTDNEACITIEPKISFEPPYPNPATTETRLRYILPEGGEATIEVYDVGGNLEIQEDYEDLPRGLNQFILNVATLDAGTYLIKFRYKGSAIVSKIIKL